MAMLARFGNTQGARVFAIDHGDRACEFEGGIYERQIKDAPGADNPIRLLNEYWEYLGQYSPEKIERIFEIYRVIRGIFDDYNDIDTLQYRCIPLVSELLDFHAPEDMTRWLMTKTNIVIPADLQVEYVHNDEKPGSRDKTYLRGDYIKLIGMCMSLRCMIPVWSHFIWLTKGDAGTDWKEETAFHLISRSCVYNCEAMVNLRKYAQEIVNADPNNLGRILKTIGTVDYPDYMVACVCVSRCPVVNISGHNGRNIISIIYPYLNPRNSTMNTMGRNGNVVAKRLDGSGGDDGGDGSQIECYKVSHPITVGEQRMGDYRFSDKPAILTTLTGLFGNTDDYELFMEIWEAAEPFRKKSILPCQRVLASYALTKWVSPTAIGTMGRDSVINALCISAIHYLKMDLPDIAVICTAWSTQKMTIGSTMISGADARLRLSAETQQALLANFPNLRSAPNKREVKPRNVAIEALQLLARELSRCDWAITLPNRLLPERLKTATYMSAPPDISSRLARILLSL